MRFRAGFVWVLSAAMLAGATLPAVGCSSAASAGGKASSTRAIQCSDTQAGCTCQSIDGDMGSSLKCDPSHPTGARCCADIGWPCGGSCSCDIPSIQCVKTASNVCLCGVPGVYANEPTTPLEGSTCPTPQGGICCYYKSYTGKYSVSGAPVCYCLANASACAPDQQVIASCSTTTPNLFPTATCPDGATPTDSCSTADVGSCSASDGGSSGSASSGSGSGSGGGCTEGKHGAPCSYDSDCCSDSCDMANNVCN